jgi:hypothetical protein
MNYDELSGVELARAVAERRGWLFAGDARTGFVDLALIGEHVIETTTTCYWISDNGQVGASGAGMIEYKKQYGVGRYTPDCNIAQAWELDGEGWYWEYIEFHSGYSNGPTTGLAVYVRDRNGGQIAGAGVELADFPTKAHAYATARCRAYLKAMEVAR